MDSVLIDPPSPDQLHYNFSQAANGAAQAIKQFTQLLEDSKTQEVMEKAKERRMENSEGITSWQVSEHENWLDVKQDGNDDVDKEEEGTAEAGDCSDMKDVNAALDKFRSSHAAVEASLDEDSRKVTVSYLQGFVQVQVTLKYASSICLCRPKSSSRLNSVPPLKAITITALRVMANQNFTQRFLRQSEHGQGQTI